MKVGLTEARIQVGVTRRAALCRSVRARPRPRSAQSESAPRMPTCCLSHTGTDRLLSQDAHKAAPNLI